MSFKHLLILLLISKVFSIWPPPYKINLDNSETFQISDFEDNDEIINNEDEMIPPLETDINNKFLRLDKMVGKINKRNFGQNAQKKSQTLEKEIEINFDLEEPLPWEAKYVVGNSSVDNGPEHILQQKSKQKREEEKEENYDYKNLQKEYDSDVAKLRLDNDTLNFTDVKETESFNDAVDTIVDFKKEIKNCTREETKGIGLSAIKCIIQDIENPNEKNSTWFLLKKITRISLIWFCIYLAIAIPCWCQRGWCCCCCFCKICKPRKRLDEAKKFLIDNPVGVLHTKDGVINYEPTHYEIYAQQNFEKALFNL